MKKTAGFTLIELLIVIVVVSILAMVAFPSYRDSIRKSDRRAAQAAMMEIANRERQFFVANRTFADETALGFTLPAELEGKYTFEIVVSNGPPPSFEILFDAIGVQAPDGDLTLDSAGVRTPEGKW
jgi:type IV pilus assembly protein PilE